MYIHSICMHTLYIYILKPLSSCFNRFFSSRQFTNLNPQCVAVCCSVLHRVASCCSVLQYLSTIFTFKYTTCCSVLLRVVLYCNVLQCVVVYCSVSQCLLTIYPSKHTRWCTVLLCVTMCCIVLQCATECCSVSWQSTHLSTHTKTGVGQMDAALWPPDPPSPGVLQCVAVCCSVLQWTAVDCSVLQCVASCCAVWPPDPPPPGVLQCVAACCSGLQCVAFYCEVWPPDSPRPDVLQCVVLCCSVLQCDECVTLFWIHLDYSSLIQPFIIVLSWLNMKALEQTATHCKAPGGGGCVAVCCSVLQCVAVCCSVLQCVAVCCSVLQCVAVKTLCWHNTKELSANQSSGFVLLSHKLSSCDNQNTLLLARILCHLWACVRVLLSKSKSQSCRYGVATVSRIDKIIGIFCRILFLL